MNCVRCEKYVRHDHASRAKGYCKHCFQALIKEIGGEKNGA